MIDPTLSQIERSFRDSGVMSNGPEAVTAEIFYLGEHPEKPACFMYELDDGRAQENCKYVAHTVRIVNARRWAFGVNLDTHGFEMVDAPTRVVNFGDESQILGTYYEETRELVLEVTGGVHAIVFDHLVREREADRRPLDFGRHGNTSMVGPVGRVHNDLTEFSGLRRLQTILGSGAAPADGRYSIVNVWRPIEHPVFDTPLALCDSRSIRRDELVASDIHYPARSGEIYQVLHGDQHRWAYFDRLAPQEAIVFKQFDSALNVSRFTPHAAFDLPGVPADVPRRKSIEARVLVLY
jgi:hypothetical protein